MGKFPVASKLRCFVSSDEEFNTVLKDFNNNYEEVNEYLNEIIDKYFKLHSFIYNKNMSDTKVINLDNVRACVEHFASVRLVWSTLLEYSELNFITAIELLGSRVQGNLNREVIQQGLEPLFGKNFKRSVTYMRK
ncbi:MAG: hypothetical protein RR440_00370 [Erysipelotrichaceae bacterium]